MADKREVSKAVEGCVVNWDAEVQVHRITGKRFDFSGNALPDRPEMPALPTPKKEDADGN